MPQFARPTTDITDGGWTTDTGGTALAAAIDETVASDADYIQSSADPSGDIVRVKLGSLTDPASSTGHVVRYRIDKSGTGMLDLTVRLVQGVSTVIAEWTHANVAAGPTDVAQTLTGPQTDAITDYTDLSLEWEAALAWPVPTNNLVTAVGDSITVANAAATGGTVPGVTGYGKYQAQTCNASGVGGYLTWACILPKTGDTAATGKMRWGGVHATGGMTVNQVLTTHVQGADSPLNDAIRAGICVICAGQNDAAAMTSQSAIDSRVADVQTICETLAANGILPVIAACPPNNTNPANIQNYNTSLAAKATQLGVTFVDFHTPCANPDGTWKTNYNGAGTDAVHPSVIGAVAMGQALRDALDSLLPATTPTLATIATDDAANYLYKNGSFTDDANADGVPDGGQTQTATFWSQTANGCAWSLGVRSGYDGKALRWNKTTDPGDSQLQSTGGGVVGNPIVGAVDGHALAFGFRAEIASWSANTRLEFACWKQLDATIKPLFLRLLTDALYTTPVAPFVWYQEWTVPTGFDDADGGKFRLNMSAGGTGTNTIDAYVGQYTMRDNSV